MVKLSLSDFVNNENKQIKDLEINLIENLKTIQNKINRDKIDCYNRIYLNCVDKIIKVSKNNKTITIYYPPKNTFIINDYDLSECLNYLSNKFKSLNFETKIINDYILISWENIFK